MRPLHGHWHLVKVHGWVCVVRVPLYAPLSQRLSQQRYRRLHPSQASAGRVERHAGSVVLGSVPAGTNADLETPLGNRVNSSQFLREQDRVPEVVVEHERSDAQSRHFGGHLQERQACDTPEVICAEQDVVALTLRAPGVPDQLLTRRLAGLDDQPESKRPAHAPP